MTASDQNMATTHPIMSHLVQRKAKLKIQTAMKQNFWNK